METNPQLQERLQNILKKFTADVGTIHSKDDKNVLNTVAHTTNIPEFLVEATAHIPIGKGIAGTTAQKKTPTVIKNLSGETPKFVMPGAKIVGLGGCVCVPILQNEQVVGAISIGWNEPYEASEQQVQELVNIVNANEFVDLIISAKDLNSI